MSEPSEKRQKTTTAASAGVRAIGDLPPELLETICGCLDVQALCTAGLVCTQFHHAASRCLRSVQLPIKTLWSRPQTTLTNFPNLSRLSIADVKDFDIPMLAQSPVAGAVTHLRVDSYSIPVSRRTRNAARLPPLPFPNLTSLTVTRVHCQAAPFPHTLRDLTLARPVTDRGANLVTGLTNLTCLQINVRCLCNPFEAVTALTALQRLEISCTLSLIPIVVELRLLTHLQFKDMPAWDSAPHSALVSLTRLNRLVHLGIGPLSVSSERHFTESMVAFTSLRSLDLHLKVHTEQSAFRTVDMMPLSHLIALRLESLALDASFLPRFNLKALKDLSLNGRVRLDQGAVVALRRATGLTQLQLSDESVCSCAGTEQLGITLSSMSRLRALSLCTFDAFQGTSCCAAIGHLTELTRLSLGGRGLATDAGVQVCLGLRKLRVLTVSFGRYSTPAPAECLTFGTFIAIANLPELHEFNISRNLGIRRGDFADGAWALLNAERHDKGWPPLELKFQNGYGP